MNISEIKQAVSRGNFSTSDLQSLISYTRTVMETQTKAFAELRSIVNRIKLSIQYEYLYENWREYGIENIVETDTGYYALKNECVEIDGCYLHMDKDEEYYVNTNESFTFADGKVTRSWGTATAKNVADTLWTQADSDNGDLPSDKEVGDVKTEGLKTQKKRNVKQQAEGLLAPTDWYVVKAAEVSDYSVPSNITTFRSAVRTKSNEMETAINNASDAAALETLYTYTEQEDGSVTRPLGQFPTLED